MYTSKTTVLIKEKDKGAMEELLSEYKLESDRNIYNEMEILRSYKLVGKTVRSLDFEISYFAKGNIRESEIYRKAPYTVQLDTTFENPMYKKMMVTFLSDSSYTLSMENVGTFNGIFGEPLRNPFISLTLYKSAFFSSNLLDGSPEYYFVINNLDHIIDYYVNTMNIELVNKNSSILAVSINGKVYNKEIQFLSKLTETYLANELENKNRMITNTVNFIDALLIEIADSLKGAEKKLERFRTEEKMGTIESASESIYDQVTKLEEERATLLVKDRYYHYLQDYINNDYDIFKIVAPSLMGIEEPMLNSLVQELYKLNSDQATLGFSAKNKNPTYNILELKIKHAKKALSENIKNVLVASKIALDDNSERLAKARMVVRMLPGKEMNLNKITRQFNLNDEIYYYLLQKRTDASITKAANAPDNMVVNDAYLVGKISPNEKKTYIICLLLALLLPSVFIIVKLLFNTAVISQEMITSATSIPLLGIIGHNQQGDMHPIIQSPRSFFSESVRSLRVNLKYLATQKNNKIIGVTSTISGEGKTFFALNLATSIATSNASVLIIGADMRKPKLHENLNMSNDLGLSNYLINKASLEEIIGKTDVLNLDVILSGPLPPNPTELLETVRMKELIDRVSKMYDYVIIDAAPIGLVADYYLLTKYTDANLYMIRYNYTQVSMLENIDRLYKTGKLKDVFMVFNDVKETEGYGYGYGYKYSGYGYYDTNRHSFWKWFKWKK
jgi:tyrosine-protein kinase Etk/Wzc